MEGLAENWVYLVPVIVVIFVVRKITKLIPKGIFGILVMGAIAFVGYSAYISMDTAPPY